VPIGISLIMPGVEESNLVNPAHERITGITEEELTKPGAFERATHPDDWKRHHALVKSYKSGAIDRFTLEKRYVHAGGKIVWVSLTRRMFTDSTTGQQYSITTLADITDLKAAQEDVARERARFKFIFEAVPVGISWMVPGNDETHIVNPAHERITGVSAEDSRKPLAFARVSHPGDYQRQRELVPKFINGEIDQYSVEKRYLHPDGRIVWAVLTSRMFTDPATGVKQSVTTLVDITDVKQAQEAMLRQQARFKFIFDAVPVGFTWMVCDRIDTRIVNPAHARITGVPMEHCHELKRYWDATHPDDRTQQRALHDRLLAGEIDHYEMEKRYMHPDGTVAWCVVAIRFYRDEATRETQEITTVVDITERKQAEARLAETHRQLLETSRQAGMAEVATGVLHNVGNVLNSVNVSTTMLTDLVRQSKIDKLARFAELLLQQPDLGAFFRDDPRGRKVPSFVQTLSTHLGREQAELLGELESLRKNVEHIKDIVAMQQSYARVCGVSEEIGVVELIEDALRMNAGAFVRHDIAIVRQFEVQPIVTVEKHKVLQILVNLMRNAKYACDDSGRADKQMIIRVWMEHGRVKIAVSDNGVGIPPENLTRIFSHGFTTRKHGHGFGLHSGAIVAKELGGAIHAHSDGPGLGATFILELPHNPDAKAA
jgi:PAS domain S-box-containing protein